MGTTYSIKCLQCDKIVWVGQGSAKFTLYRDRRSLGQLEKFLVEHSGHDLKFGSDEMLKISSPKCPKCDGIHFRHMHDCMHGLEGTHMTGTERYVCEQCGYSVHEHEGTPLGFRFVLDGRDGS